MSSRSWWPFGSRTDESDPAAAAAQLPRLVAGEFYGYLRPSECGLRVWLKAHDYEESPRGAFGDLLIKLGLEHEARHLTRFPGHLDIGQLPRDDREAATTKALNAGERVIYQGRMSARTTLGGREVEIIGVPDFMLPAREGYAIRDSKLARSVSDYIRLQLLTYGWLYEQTMGAPPASLQAHAGSGEIIDVPYEGGEEPLELFERILELRLAEQQPDEHVGVAKCSGCGFYERCWPAALERRDVGVLAGLDRGLISELHDRGIDTIDSLREQFDAESLAALERPWGNGIKPVGAKAARILKSAESWTSGQPILFAPPQLPDHQIWVMFDLEGIGPTLDELEKIYIWGTQCFGAEPGPFRAATAGFGRHGDREGWEDFLRLAGSIFATHGDIPFVHWASYEKTKINLYLARYGDRDGVAERIKRNLLDLLPITYESVAVPLSGYGLKGIETLTGYKRQLKESGGDWSMARYIEATETEDEAERAAIIDEILAYNREDLEATWAVLEWLKGLGSGPQT